ncbi:MAG TPA: right-handed parallel beta-helix repeat-containing protein [Usitatibacter sp.]|jgi:hypothetical protein|nr:right-handed parallel beta-helix repeat-containing protein [Usitatibacter sp.]
MPFAIRNRTALASVFAALSLGALAAPKDLKNCVAITEPGSYVLTRNITATSDCFVIQADFVTLDLAGFVITGNGGGAGIAEFLGAGHQGIVVRNGAVTNFQDAIALPHSTAVTVEAVNATGNSFDGIVLGDEATVKNSTVASNGGMGMRLGQRALVTGNNVNANAGSGILVDIGGNVAGNTVGRNQASGIVAFEGALLVNNVSRNNMLDGISVDCPSAVISNTTSNNQGQNLDMISGACDPNSQACCVVTAHNSTL